MQRRVVLVVLACGLTVLGDCRRDRQAAVWVEPGSTARHLVFGVAAGARDGPPLPRLEAFSVRPPSVPGRGTSTPYRAVVWEVVATGGADRAAAAAPRRIEFGHAPPGYVAAGNGTVLLPGTYVAEARGPGYRGAAHFVVRADGSLK